MQHFQFSFLQFGTLSNKPVLFQDCLILSFGVDFRSSSSLSFPRVTFMRSANISIESWHHEFRFIAHFPGLPADFFPGCKKGMKKLRIRMLPGSFSIQMHGTSLHDWRNKGARFYPRFFSTKKETLCSLRIIVWPPNSKWVTHTWTGRGIMGARLGPP